MVGSELLRYQNGVLGNANVGDLKTLTNVSGLTVGNGTNGGLAANYTLSGGTQTMSITKRPITISGSRFYDGTSTVNSSDITTFIIELVGDINNIRLWNSLYNYFRIWKDNFFGNS